MVSKHWNAQTFPLWNESFDPTAKQAVVEPKHLQFIIIILPFSYHSFINGCWILVRAHSTLAGASASWAGQDGLHTVISPLLSVTDGHDMLAHLENRTHSCSEVVSSGLFQDSFLRHFVPSWSWLAPPLQTHSGLCCCSSSCSARCSRGQLSSGWTASIKGAFRNETLMIFVGDLGTCGFLHY